LYYFNDLIINSFNKRKVENNAIDYIDSSSLRVGNRWLKSRNELKFDKRKVENNEFDYFNPGYMTEIALERYE